MPSRVLMLFLEAGDQFEGIARFYMGRCYIRLYMYSKFGRVAGVPEGYIQFIADLDFSCFLIRCLIHLFFNGDCLPICRYDRNSPAFLSGVAEGVPFSLIV